MDKLASIKAFVTVVEEGGFAAAARALGLSRSVVNRQVIQLEDSLKTQLFTRNTRNVAATETGRAYYHSCKGVLADLERAELDVLSQTKAPRGTIKVNAPMSFGMLHLGPAVADYLARFPDVDIQLQLDDRRIDPVEEGFDVTVRIGTLSDSSLIARRIAPIRMALCASPAYLADKGTPQVPRDLKDHSCLHYGYLPTGANWTLSRGEETVQIPVRGVLCSNNGEVLINAATAGLGIALQPVFIASPYLDDGSLVPILTDWSAPELAVHALYAPNRHMTPKVRTFIDFLVDRFGRNPPWDQ